MALIQLIMHCTIDKSQKEEPATTSRDPVLLETIRQSLNGTWDLIVSFSDVSPYAAKRFDPGECP